MKKRILALLLATVLIFAFSVTCFAKKSPNSNVLEGGEGNGNGEGNQSDTSPKTGTDLAGAFVAVITATGVVLVSKKKFSEAN